LLVESLGRLAHRHLVLFVIMEDEHLRDTIAAAPARVEEVARAVVVQSLLKDRAIVLEKLQRLGVQCLDVPKEAISAELLNRYLRIKERSAL
ncbi:MAG TPA: hypothetical protein VKT70_09615, partial [Stellaceae bacterium]|nr:hypothetical protein [Stellaceae bacterium]